MRRFGSAPKPSQRVRMYMSSEVGRRRRPDGRSGRRRSGRGSSSPRPARRGSSTPSRSRPSAGARTSPTSAPSSSASAIASATRLADPGLDPLGLVQLLRDADAEPLQVFRGRDLDRLRQLDGRRVERVAARDDRVEERVVPNRLRDRADLVEARRERDDAVARDGAVGRPQPDEPAERGGLLDRPAGVGPERPRREAPGDRGRRAAGRAAGHARRDPTGCAIGPYAEFSVDEPMANSSMFVLPSSGQPGVLAARGDRRVEDGDVALEDLRARPWSARPSS